MGITSNSTVAQSGYTTTLRNNMKQIYQSQLSSNFASTLGQVTDIVNILISQAYYESTFNVNALSPVNPPSSSVVKDYLTAPAVANLLKTGNPTQIANIHVGAQALGLGQSLGLNSVRGGSAKTGKCLVEAARPDLAGTLCVNPGDDLIATFLGDANIQKALMLQMVVLEQKYKNVVSSTGGWTSKGDVYNRVFASRIEAAVAAYLGLGSSDINGTTPSAYAASIVGGQTYVIANSTTLQVAQRNLQVASSSGPTTNGSSQAPIVPAGC